MKNFVTMEIIFICQLRLETSNLPPCTHPSSSSLLKTLTFIRFSIAMLVIPGCFLKWHCWFCFVVVVSFISGPSFSCLPCLPTIHFNCRISVFAFCRPRTPAWFKLPFKWNIYFSGCQKLNPERLKSLYFSSYFGYFPLLTLYYCFR